MNYLCFDYGDKHIGIAYSSGFLAEPLMTVTLERVQTIVPELIKKYAIQTLVFGLSEGEMAAKTRLFASTLQSLVKLPIVFHDETLSSQETRLHLAQSGKRKKSREAKIDHIVAAAILNDYLDTLPSSTLLDT